MSEWNEAIQKMQGASAPAVSAKEKSLLPCPFCGGEPSVSTHQDESLWSHNMVTKTQVSCRECDISFESEPGYEFEAPDAWNRRAALSATEDEAEPVARVTFEEVGPVCKYFTEIEGRLASLGLGAHDLYASPPSAPAGVKVKPLEWVKEEDEDWWSAPALGYPDAYAVWVSGLGAVRLRLRREDAFSLFAGTLDEAKAAAQSDYESRIRSSLQPDTQAHGGGVEAVREAQRLERQTFKDAAEVNAANDRLKEALHDLLTRPTDGAARARARAALAASPAAPAAAGVDVEAVKALRTLIADCRHHLSLYRPGPLAQAEAFLASLSPAPDAKGER